LTRETKEKDRPSNKVFNAIEAILFHHFSHHFRPELEAKRRPAGAIEEASAVPDVGSSQFPPKTMEVCSMLCLVCLGYSDKEIVDGNITMRCSQDEATRPEGGRSNKKPQEFLGISLNLRTARLAASRKAPSTALSIRASAGSRRRPVAPFSIAQSEDNLRIVCLKALNDLVSIVAPRVFRPDRQLTIIKMDCAEAGIAPRSRRFPIISRLLALSAVEVVTKSLNLFIGQKTKFQRNVTLPRQIIVGDIHNFPLVFAINNPFSTLPQSEYPYNAICLQTAPWKDLFSELRQLGANSARQWPILLVHRSPACVARFGVRIVHLENRQ